MKDLEISKALRDDIENNQVQLKNAIRNHQGYVFKLQRDPDNVDLQKDIDKAEQEIVLIGLTQKNLLERLRDEYKDHQKSVKANIVKNSIEERRFNLSNALSRARKQNIVSRPASVSVSSASDDSVEVGSNHSIDGVQVFRPLIPDDLTQSEFLNIFGLVTHDAYKEMQNKRVERKRRSTANPHFLYGNKGWDFPPKRKKNSYLYRSISPPNTRQAVKKRNERISPPTVTNGGAQKSAFAPFPSIPNLPSGLTIERVSPASSPDAKMCITCRQSGSLLVCDNCSNGFHVSCHNKPFSQTPKQCPRCLNREGKNGGSSNLSTGMSVSYVRPEITEKLEEKKKLESEHKLLTAELTQLQDKHSQLTISLKNQENQREDLLMSHKSTEDKIKQILAFINTFKNNGTTKATVAPPSAVTS